MTTGLSGEMTRVTTQPCFHILLFMTYVWERAMTFSFAFAWSSNHQTTYHLTRAPFSYSLRVISCATSLVVNRCPLALYADGKKFDTQPRMASAAGYLYRQLNGCFWVLVLICIILFTWPDMASVPLGYHYVCLRGRTDWSTPVSSISFSSRFHFYFGRIWPCHGVCDDYGLP